MTQITRNLIFVAIALLASISASAAFIEIQPFVICEDDGSNCAQSGFYEAETDKIWAQAGIDVNFLAMQQLNNTAWLDVNVGSGSVVAQETIDVMQAGAAINDSLTTLAINMFFVDFLDSSSGFYGLGCGADVFSVACAGEVGVFIAGNVFNTNRIDTIAHEIGHVLELFHVTIADRLMATGSTRTTPSTIDDITPDGLGLSVLTSAEIATALGSKFVQADTGETEVPEPSTLMLLLTGLLAFRFRKRPMA